MNISSIRTAALVAAVVLGAACGQKDGVGNGQASSGEALGPAPAETMAPVPDATATTTADPASPATGARPSGEAGTEAVPAAPGQAAPTPASPTTAPRAKASAGRAGSAAAPAPAPAGGPSGRPAPAPGSATQPKPGGTAAPAPGPAPAPAPGPAGPVDRTGVTDAVIKVGIHAPVTGAAPLPQNSFDKGKDTYWQFLADKGGVHGRTVEVVFRDDQYNPARALQVCRELVEQEKVFLLIGAAGTEQVTACAQYANSKGVPYLSSGGNEEGLKDLRTYFAVSQSHIQQSGIIAGMVKKELKKQKVAIVVNSTPVVDEVVRSASEALRAAGLTITRTSRIGKNASDSELLAEANQLKASGAEAVYVMTAPVNFIKLATNARAQAYAPTWVGPGVTNGINLVAEAGCPSIEGARFLSPFPQLDVVDKFDPDFKPAYAKYSGGEADDIGLAQWGINKVLHKMFEAVGRDLSRQSFLATLTSGIEFNTNLFPTVKFSPTSRFGATTSHVLEADCQRREYKTVGTFIADY